MRIAILYSGLLRTLPETIDNNLNYFDGCDIDLYFSLWDRVGYADQINAPDNIKGKRLIDELKIVDEELVKEIMPPDVKINCIRIELYKKAYQCQLNLINGLDHSGLASQFYKNWDCFTLLDQTINYDFIVKMRCDLLLNQQIEMEEIKKLVNDHKIIFASKIWYDYSWQKGITNINDMLWIANKEMMEKACYLYHNVHKINAIIESKKQTILNHGENICFMNLEAEHMVDDIHTFDFDYQVVR
jgi:hypothetical protein